MWIWFGYMSRVSDSGLLGVEGLGVLHGLGCKLQGPNPELIRSRDEVVDGGKRPQFIIDGAAPPEAQNLQP